MTIADHPTEIESSPPTYSPPGGSLPHRLFTVREYERMAEVGILQPDERVELLEGEIVPMSPIGPRHSIILSMITRLFVTLFSKNQNILVIGQGPAKLSWLSMPQPDIAIVDMRIARGTMRHPEPGDVYLVIEVSDTTLRQDLGLKCKLYAKAGIREYWVVDLAGGRIVVHRSPDAEKESYNEVKEIRQEQEISLISFPELTVKASDVLPNT